MKTFTDLYKRLTVEGQITHIPTQRLSQDHLEAFFGKIRALNGYNNNPNCQQFNAAMRKLLANTAIAYSDRGNCTIEDSVSIYNPYSNISTISSRRHPKAYVIPSEDFTPDDVDEVLKALDEIEKSGSKSRFTDLNELNIAFIASTIKAKIEGSDKILCDRCNNVFAENEQVHQAFTSTNHTRRAYQSTFEICRAADYFLKLEMLKGQFSFDLIRHSIISSLKLETLYCETDFEGHIGHKDSIIEYVVQKYISYKGNYMAKTITFDEFEQKLRRKLTRLVINSNQ